MLARCLVLAALAVCSTALQLPTPTPHAVSTAARPAAHTWSIAARPAPRARAPRADGIADAAYGIGLLAVVTLVGRTVFDSVFIENDSTTPDKPWLSLPNPFGGGSDGKDPTLEAERIREALQAAAKSGDIETAYRLEKELKQFLWDNNVVYEINVAPQRTGLRVKDLEEAASGDKLMGSENSWERDQMLKDLE